MSVIRVNTAIVWCDLISNKIKKPNNNSYSTAVAAYK